MLQRNIKRRYPFCPLVPYCEPGKLVALVEKVITNGR